MINSIYNNGLVTWNTEFQASELPENRAETPEVPKANEKLVPLQQTTGSLWRYSEDRILAKGNDAKGSGGKDKGSSSTGSGNASGNSVKVGSDISAGGVKVTVTLGGCGFIENNYHGKDSSGGNSGSGSDKDSGKHERP